jgi:glyoxylase-like metal-dependent hydrolase (beta-lactamase superfamily II)
VEPVIDVTRRTFLVRAGQGSLALAVLTVAGCGPTALASAAAGAEEPSMPGDGGGAGGTAAASGSGAGGAPPVSPEAAVTWHRANLGNVSAYILARAGEAAVVDTGVENSEGAIGEALSAAGLGWDAVGHVILTHRHRDHAGSIDAVLAAAKDAAAYAGAADIPAITTTQPLVAVGDGETVFGLRIVATPGHTMGHVAVLDEVGGLLVAGDALRTVGGTLAGSNPAFTDDVAEARASVAKLGELRYETLLVGHGEPILTGASAQVAALAAAG